MTEPEIIKFHQQVLLKLQEAIELTTMLGDEEKLKEYKTEYERVKSDDKYFRERYLE